jgi:hypothetical protein
VSRLTNALRNMRSSRDYVAAPSPFDAGYEDPAAFQGSIDLVRRRDQLNARVAELQWDLGGLVYEMVIRNSVRVDVLVRRAALLQDADAELGEIERILRMEQTGSAGACTACGAPHSPNAGYCWQCGQPLLQQLAGDAVTAPHPLAGS